jgi:hypothetical protein
MFMPVIYVLPTEEGKPPRALVGEAVQGALMGVQVEWSGEDGRWKFDGEPLEDELSEAITEHARSLGVVVVEAAGT